MFKRGAFDLHAKVYPIAMKYKLVKFAFCNSYYQLIKLVILILTLSISNLIITNNISKDFCDPFWNSQTQSFYRHLFKLMTCWAVVCDVYFLEPQKIQPQENATQFANRVKHLIAKKAKLQPVPWDGIIIYLA